MEGILVPITLFAAIAAVILVPQYLRSRERERLHETLRQAFDKGQPIPPEMVEALQGDRPLPSAARLLGPERDLRRGVLYFALGAGVLAIGVIGYAALYSTGGAVEFLSTFASLAAIPAFVGLGYLILYALGRRKAA